MITSYVTPEGDMLYLSLIGRLDGDVALELVNEYHVRFGPDVRRCVLDLAGADAATAEGATVLDRLWHLAATDRVELSLVARGSAVERTLAEAARRHGVPLVDGTGLPLAR